MTPLSINILFYIVGILLCTSDGRATIAFIGQAGHGITGVMNSIAAHYDSNNPNSPRPFYESKLISNPHFSRTHKTLLSHQNSVLFGVSGYMIGSAHLVSAVKEDVAYLTKEGSVKGIVLVVNSQAPIIVREIQTIAGIFVKAFGVTIETSFRILCTRAPFGHIDACRRISNQVRKSLQSRLKLNITEIPFWTIENHPEHLTQLMISTEDIDDEVKNRHRRTLDEFTHWLHGPDSPQEDGNNNTAAAVSMRESLIEDDSLIDPLVASILFFILIPFIFFTFCTRKVISYTMVEITTGQAVVATEERHCNEYLKKNSYTNEVESNPVAGGDSEDGGAILPSSVAINNTLHVLLSSPLVLNSDSKSLKALPGFDTDNEIDVFKQVGTEVNRDISIRFDVATMDTFSTLLSLGCCQALHFSGHGTTSGLCFEDGICGLHIITAKDLKELLDARGDHSFLQFVFLSSCYSQEIGQVFIDAGVHYCVCVKKDLEIQDSASIVFTRAFYRALFSGKSVPASFEDAQATLQQSSQIYEKEKEASKFILLHRESFEQRQDVAPLFIGDRLVHDSWPVLGMKHCVIGMSELDIHTYDEAKDKLPTLSSGDFIGREVMVYEIIQLLLEKRKRLVTLYGERGVGKSSVAAAVCRMLIDRVEMTWFTGGIIYFDASASRGYPSFHDGLQEKLSDDFYDSPAGLMIQAVLTKQSNGPLPSSALVVLDNMHRSVIASAEFRSLLKLLLDTCPHLKVLVTSENKLLNNRFISVEGVVEYPFVIGPLSLRCAVKLFAKTTPILHHSRLNRRSFIRAFQPIIDTDPNGRLYSEALERFHNGIPSYIIQMAGDSTFEEVDALKRWAENMQASPH